jgi:hypothetical protein
MTRHNELTCIHEPFGDAFYFGPERLGTRYESDEKARKESGFAESTYRTILDRIDHESEEVRCFLDFSDYCCLPASCMTCAMIGTRTLYTTPVNAPVAGISPTQR